MDLRKIVSFGNSSFVVSLPRAWVMRNRLKKGDLVSIDETPTSLVLTAKDTAERREFKEITIDARTRPISELKTEIISSYINNYDLITVHGFKDSRKVKEILHELIGIEIIEETSNKITAKDLLDITEVSIDNIIRRSDLLTKSMLEDLSIEKDNYDSLFERDKEVNRLAMLGLRLVRAVAENPRLLRAFNTTAWEITIARQVIMQIERFADQIKRIGRALRAVKDKGKRRLFQKNYLVVKGRYSEVMKVFYSRDKQRAIKMENETKSLLRQCDEFSEQCRERKCSTLSEYLKQMIITTTSILRATMETS